MATDHIADDQPAAPDFYVRDVEASVRFYVDTLGFELVRRNDYEATVRLGMITVHIHHRSRRPRRHAAGPDTLTAFIPGFVTPEADAVYHRVRRARAVVIDETHDRATGARDFVTVDPDGFPLRFAGA